MPGYSRAFTNRSACVVLGLRTSKMTTGASTIVSLPVRGEQMTMPSG
jgi:hypothetical protein